MFYLVSGAAASGKTTTARQIAPWVDQLVAHDHDEKKTPDVDTRCAQLEEWIQLALTHQANGKDFLLTSHAPLGELLACPSAPKLAGISACLIDCDDPVRIQRMRDRGFDPNWPPSQHVLNWASWHRMHAWDPRWEQDVIVGNGPDIHDYGRWTAWDQADSRWQVNLIDTTQLTVDQVMTALSIWIDETKSSKLTAESKWWLAKPDV